MKPASLLSVAVRPVSVSYTHLIPFGMQTLKLAGLALWPFGKEVRSGSRSGGCLYILMNVIWIFVGGIWICLSHLLFGAVLCITIIGIPFGLQHFKLAALALSPFGKDIICLLYTSRCV